MTKGRFLQNEENEDPREEEEISKKEKHIKNLFFKSFNPSKGIPADLENMKAKLTKALGNIKP